MRKNDRHIRNSPESARKCVGSDVEKGLVFPGSSRGTSEFDKSWCIFVILKKFSQHATVASHWIENNSLL